MRLRNLRLQHRNILGLLRSIPRSGDPLAGPIPTSIRIISNAKPRIPTSINMQAGSVHGAAMPQPTRGPRGMLLPSQLRTASVPVPVTTR